MRPRQKLPFDAGNLPVLPTFETGENGQAFEKLVDYSKVELPAVETTNLRACLDAGVNLKEVPSKIFGIKEVVVDMAPQETTETQTFEEGEN